MTRLGSVDAHPTIRGRDRELDTIADLLDDGTSVVIAGPPGVGKSALWRAVAARRTALDEPLLSIVATAAAATIPMGPLAPLLPPGTARQTGIDRVLAALEAVRAAATATSGAPILAVDDAHLLDDSSAGVVRQLVDQGDAVVLATVRSRQSAPDAVVGLWKDGLAARIELGPLDLDEVASVAGDLLGGVIDHRTARLLYRATEGNALFLRELVATGRESGALRNVERMWSWQGELVAGPALTDLLEARVGALEPEERRAIELLALGEPLPLAVLERLVTPSVVERLERRGLIRTGDDDRRAVAQSAHPLYTSTIRQEVPRARARRDLLALADAVLSLGARRRHDTIQVASWLMDARDTSRPDLLIAAADRARGDGQPRLAAALARAAVDAGGGEAAERILRQALTWVGEVDGSVPTLPTGSDRAADEQRVQLARTRTDAFFVGIGDLDDVEDYVDAALAGCSAVDLRQEIAAVRLAPAMFGRGRPALAGGAALELVDGLTARTRVQSAIAICPALALAGRADQSLDIATRVEADLESSALPFAGLLLGAGRTLGLVMSGRIDEADRYTSERFARADTDGADVVLPGWSILCGVAQLWCGRPRTALERLTEAAAFGELDAGGFRSWCRALQAEAAAWLGIDGPAEPVPTDGSGGPHLALHDPTLRLTNAQTLMHRGRITEARAAALDAADAAAAKGQTAVEVLALHLAARIGPAGPPARRINAIGPVLEGSLMAVACRHADALAADEAVDLEEVAAEWAHMGANALTAEALLAAEAAASRAGQRGVAARCHVAALEATIRCEAPPALPLERAGTPQLTRRERDAARLAADGLTNGEIAARLGVSVRTVHTHLQSVYAKVGSNDRHQLAAFLDPPPNSILGTPLPM